MNADVMRRHRFIIVGRIVLPEMTLDLNIPETHEQDILAEWLVREADRFVPVEIELKNEPHGDAIGKVF